MPSSVLSFRRRALAPAILSVVLCGSCSSNSGSSAGPTGGAPPAGSGAGGTGGSSSTSSSGGSGGAEAGDTRGSAMGGAARPDGSMVSNTGGTANTGGEATGGEPNVGRDASVDGEAGVRGEDGGIPKTGASGLPIPPGGGIAKPVGTPGNLTIVNWAGFQSAVSWTFDDSQPSQIDHWADLRAEGIRMTFYLNSSGNWYPNYDTTWNDVAARGSELGNHTVNHCHAPDTTGCANYLGSLDLEIDQCSAYIETRLGQSNVWTFASPFGDVGWEPLASSRFLVSRGVASGSIAPNDNTDPFNLPIIAASGGEAASVFDADIDTAVTQGRWLIFLFHTILPDPQNWIAGVDISSITGSIDHGKSIANLWIDSVVNVAAYWRAQKLLASATPTTSGLNRTWTWSLPPHFPAGKYLRVKVDGGTLTQGAGPLPWDEHGYYEIALDAGTLTLSP